ncbi:MAG: segregation/condensation protein A [Desulfuromonadaceae bacterium]|nr:segregation/condensation protein A [Desulfuromonas sp.]MDY0185209.1 segregation/condensation protein A [Desulfuromonadaceae bacterium]
MAKSAYEVKLSQFEGPLDLLLHLVQKNEMDIQDIQIATITAQYLEHLKHMEAQNIDVASDFLLMAATLLYLKSRTLLPVSRVEVEQDEGVDPEEELKQRLLEYQRYKEGAQKLEQFPRLFRDVFPRPPLALDEVDSAASSEVQPQIDISVYDLVRAFSAVMRLKQAPPVHRINGGGISVTLGVRLLLQQLHGQERVSFQRCFTAATTRLEVVVQFVAMLELIRLQLLSFEQHSHGGMVYMYPSERIRNGCYADIEHMLDLKEPLDD